ncbi:MAG TPA: DUF2298 domain-containing protein [Thermomicrobiales bacterium]|nr:DUF2298 domain-containing protein [Thermomicrobiales bacterium]
MLVNERVARMAAQVRTEGIGAAITRHAVTITLVAILILGGLLRFTNRDWDDGHNLHPDERFLTMVATDVKWPDSIREYFDSETSPLNPYNVKDDEGNQRYGSFIYGTFPLFLGKAVADLSGNDVYGAYHLSSRGLSATFDLLTVLLVFLVGRRLFGPFAGLLGALLLSLSVLDVQLAHFGTFDTFVSMLCLATFYFALKSDDTGRWWAYALAGTAAGLAIASKLSALPVIAMLGLALVEAVRREGWPAALRKPRPRSLPPVLGAGLAVICAIWTFRITQPYAFLGPNPLSFKIDPRWTRDVDYWRDVQAGIADMPPSAQWAARAPIVFVTENLVRWGLGVPLGIVALIALGLGALRLATSRRWPPTWQVILVGWPAFHILYFGTAFIKTMRYLLPAYPFLVILAAGLLASLWARGVARSPALWRRWEVIPVAAVIAATAVYAIAFVGIYGRPVTRVAASEWIFNNVPAGSYILTEHWDDGIPMGLPGYDMGDYPGEQLELYNHDDQEKLDKLLDQLDKGDYIAITSNRLYKSIPRLPERYPMTTEYYRMLFSGDLGFKLIKTFTSRPSIFGVELNDDNAEEAFTVYDHPKVLIFQKTPAYSRQAVEDRLKPELAGDIVDVRPLQVGHNLLKMDDAERRAQQAGGTWSAIFDRSSLSNRHPIRAWYLALQLMALAAVPLCWRVLGGLPDRGYAVAKTIGLLTAGWFAWLLASLHVMDFERNAVLAGIGFTAVASLVAVAPRWRAFGRDLRGRWPEILVAEAVFLVAFFAFVWFRSKNPDLWHPWRGGEKPMEFAYFNAVIRSTHFPPYDPWFAGGYINYYYFGYVLLASVVRLTGVIPSVAFNLAVPTCFALLVLNCWSFVTGVIRLLAGELRVRSRWAPLALGLLGPLFVAVIGNFDMARRIGVGDYGYPESNARGLLAFGWFGDVIRGTWRFVTDSRPLPSNAFWDPSRVIPDTINEFPYFTMLFADFHPHLMALPFTSAALLVALAVLLARRWPVPEQAAPVETDARTFGFAQDWRRLWRGIPWGSVVDRGLLIGLVALVTGVLYPLNTWDFPTYVAVTAGAFLLLEVLAANLAPTPNRHPEGTRPNLRGGESDNKLVASAEETPNLGRSPLPTAGEVLGVRAARWRLSFTTLRRTAIWTAATVVLGRLLFFPYFVHYEVPSGGFERWENPMTTPDQYLIVHGILLFFVVSFLLAELAATMPRRLSWRLMRPAGFVWGYGGEGEGRRLDASIRLAERPLEMRPAVWVAVATGVVLLLSLWRERLFLMLGFLLLLTGLVAWQRRREPIRLFLLGMVAMALALSAAVERYVLRGDVGRMNTVFKFYLQIWMLLGLVAAVGAVMMVLRYRTMLSRSSRAVWAIFAVVFIVAGLSYPVQATPARLSDRFEPMPRTLDGMAYMTEAVYDDGGPDGSNGATYPLAGDYEAIRWLEDNVQGSPVVLEGNTQLYRWGSRVSIYTGLPTVLGWDWHQTQQRAGYGDLIQERKKDVEQMLGDRVSFDAIKPLLDKYHVRYIYVGELERTYYSGAGLRKFQTAATAGKLTVVYDANGVTIYRYDGAPA